MEEMEIKNDSINRKMSQKANSASYSRIQVEGESEMT